jgi:ferredoxin-type protein NapH
MNFRRWTIARRCVQLAIIALIASPLAGLTIFRGTLAAGDLAGLPLADPLAALQVMLATGVVVPSFLLSALGVTLCYFLLGGRTFCGWVCPVYLLTEMADKLRRRFGSGERLLPLATKRWLLLATGLMTLLTGLPLFETVSPIGITGRAIAFRGWPALACLAGLLLVEVVFARRLWCRSLCPLGGFYAVIGRFAPARIRYLPERCTGCGSCVQSCFVQEVLAPCLSGKATAVTAGDCTRCCACVDTCRAQALLPSYTVKI